MPPLIYIHKGYSWYVPIALRNGKQFGDEVIYLGDFYGCNVAKLCRATTARLSQFHRRANDFAKVYRHHSNLGHEFELFCIQRWFILGEFMAKTGIDKCIYLDTDVLLTRRIDQEIAATKDYGLTYTGYSAHTCIVNCRDTLQQFLDWIMALYMDPNSEERMLEWHRLLVEVSGGGGVSDMTLFHWFQQEYPRSLGDYTTIFGQSPFDVSLEDVKEFVAAKDGFKEVIWHDGHCYAKLKGDGILHELVSLHHQGPSKSRLEEHAQQLGGAQNFTSRIAKILDLLYRCERKILGP